MPTVPAWEIQKNQNQMLSGLLLRSGVMSACRLIPIPQKYSSTLAQVRGASSTSATSSDVMSHTCSGSVWAASNRDGNHHQPLFTTQMASISQPSVRSILD